MLAVEDLRLALGTALAADAATLAPPANANKIALINAPFTPAETLDMAFFTPKLATFTGSTPLDAGVGAQNVGIDPATNQQSITMIEPAGGWRWVCTVAPTPSENIYGFILMDNGGTVLLAMEAFPAAINIKDVGHFVEIPWARLTFVLQPMS